MFVFLAHFSFVPIRQIRVKIPVPMNEWNFQSRAHACEACAKPFADRQPYHTLLYDEHTEHLRRLDVCDACWQGQFSDGARERKGFVSHWQGIFEVPPPVTEAIQKDTAETLLRKLVEQNDPRSEEHTSELQS